MAFVTVFGKNPCVQCNATYRRLDKNDTEYSKIDVTVNAETLDYLKDGLGLFGAPVVIVSEEPIEDGHYDNVAVLDSWSGFNAEKIDSIVV